MVDCAYFVKSIPLRAFTGSFQHFADIDILKMCMKKFDAEKMFIPPAKCCFSGVYCFQHVCDSEIPSTFKALAP